jgi:membrane protease YdiL (CAAX protease family)
MADWVRRYPLVAYYVLAFGLSVALALLLNVSLLFGLLALFGPAAAAFIVARTTEGGAGTARLRAAITRWRVHPGWYLAAVGLPLLAYAIAYVLYALAGYPLLAIPGPITPIALVLFFLVIGEEIGWRGFLLPGLLRERSPIIATLIVGVAWLVWHSPLYFVPGMPSYGQSFVAFAAWVIPLSFLLTFVWLGTESVWLATIMHGTANIGASLVFPVEDAATLFIYGGIGTAVVALGLVVASWSRFSSRPHPVPPAIGAAPLG